MRQYAVAAEHLGVVGWNKPDRAIAMERRLAHFEFIDVRWGRACVFHVHIVRIVHVAAEAGMCLHASAVWQIHRFGSDVVDRCAAGIDLAQRVGGLR